MWDSGPQRREPRREVCAASRVVSVARAVPAPLVRGQAVSQFREANIDSYI